MYPYLYDILQSYSNYLFPSLQHTNGAETKTNGADDSEETPVCEKEEEDGKFMFLFGLAAG